MEEEEEGKMRRVDISRMDGKGRRFEPRYQQVEPFLANHTIAHVSKHRNNNGPWFPRTSLGIILAFFPGVHFLRLKDEGRSSRYSFSVDGERSRCYRASGRAGVAEGFSRNLRLGSP